MLKKRIIAAVTVRNNIAVQSIGFERYLPIGRVDIAVEFLNQWGVDEIVINDISATREKRGVNLDIINAASRNCYTPLMVGGGISSVQDVLSCVKNGADKVLINQVMQNAPQQVGEMAKELGSQCIVASIDIKRDLDGAFRPFNYIDKSFLPYDLLEWVEVVQKMGVGELLINSVDRDGSYSGFEIEALTMISKNSSIPVIAQGGAATANCFQDLFENSEIEAVVAANFFHFFEHSVTTVKSQLKKVRSDIRVDTEFSYEDNNFDKRGRLSKKSDKTLEDLLFVAIKDEVI